MITTELKDILGTPITQGWAATLDAYSGSLYAHKVYVVGTKGKESVIYLTNTDAIDAFKETGDLKGLPTGKKKHTRVIMLNSKD